MYTQIYNYYTDIATIQKLHRIMKNIRRKKTMLKIIKTKVETPKANIKANGQKQSKKKHNIFIHLKVPLVGVDVKELNEGKLSRSVLNGRLIK